MIVGKTPPAKTSDIEAGAAATAAPLQPSLIQTQDEKENSDAMMVSYVDSFKVGRMALLNGMQRVQ